MTDYLLDTNIVSDLVRNPQGPIAAHLRKAGESRVATSILVASELRYGAQKKGSARLTLQLESVLGALQVLPFESPADEFYGRIRVELEVLGETDRVQWSFDRCSCTFAWPHLGHGQHPGVQSRAPPQSRELAAVLRPM